MTDIPRPPAHLRVYVDVLGVDDAIAFLLAFGGAELYLASRPTARSQLVQVLGQEKAHALAAIAERIPRAIPTGKPWIAVVLKSRGLSVAEIARRLHVTEATVRKWTKRERSSSTSGSQLSLF